MKLLSPGYCRSTTSSQKAPARRDMAKPSCPDTTEYRISVSKTHKELSTGKTFLPFPVRGHSVGHRSILTPALDAR